MNFGFYVSGPAATVPVKITAFGRVIGGQTGGDYFSVYTTAAKIPASETNPVFESSNLWSLRSDFNLYTNVLYMVGMAAFSRSAAYQPGGPASMDGFAIVDPTFAIDPSAPNANAYSIYFSPGIMAAPTPEPSTWLMMILGFCGLGFLACRKDSAVHFV